MNATPRTDAWKARTAARLDAIPGGRAELARFLAEAGGGAVASRKVQIAQVLNTVREPGAEFLLAVEAWLAGKKDGRQAK